MSNSRATTRPWSDADEEKLQLLLDAGKTAEEIAAELERTRGAIYARVQRFYLRRDPLKARSDRKGPTWG
jgi:hypothetical protein